jgi:hypothetical protein
MRMPAKRRARFSRDQLAGVRAQKKAIAINVTARMTIQSVSSIEKAPRSSGDYRKAFRCELSD